MRRGNILLQGHMLACFQTGLISRWFGLRGTNGSGRVEYRIIPITFVGIWWGFVFKNYTTFKLLLGNLNSNSSLRSLAAPLSFAVDLGNLQSIFICFSVFYRLAFSYFYFFKHSDPLSILAPSLFWGQMWTKIFVHKIWVIIRNSQTIKNAPNLTIGGISMLFRRKYEKLSLT